MILLWTISLLLGPVAGSEVCYDRLGCFTDDAPWGGITGRPGKILPKSPEVVNTRFLLYTNKNQDTYQEVVADASSIKSSNFRTDKKTRFIIHGFTDTGENSWLSNMCKNMFQVETVNCICVDWKGGSRASYPQATQNVQIVGAEVAYFVNTLKSSLGYSPSNVHVIGHSLGAHAAGEAGRRTSGAIGRITGLDPAEPYFQDTPELVRLDPSDAQFVDAIHTDAAPIIPNMGFGMSQTVGHLDFFPNGGLEMPGCKSSYVSRAADTEVEGRGARFSLTCNHLRCLDYYTDSILNPSGFAGFSCDSYNDFTANKCFPCPSGGCPQMGHYADRFSGKTNGVGRKFYLNTGDSSSYARWRYQVAVTLSGEKATGQILVALLGNKGNSNQYEVFQGSLQSGQTQSNGLDSNVEVGDVQKVQFIWHKTGITLSKPKVGATKIVVKRNDGKVFNFCSTDTVVEKVLLTLSSC
ncbi:pancreatic triacylglycerol lipase-like [Oryctolagus cuniculus]|uniref:pancreatic triacylglycerol lipase-like n=1 Tax=Oryctolagus cuniculus TaxID=9986 RepID=UPI003879B300